jgi:hypothetical protein
MKAILEFNLPDDQIDFDLAVNGSKWMGAMWELDKWLRSETKYAPDTISADTYAALEKSRDMLHEILQENNLKL